MSDSVNKPDHYNQGSVETIEGIRAALGDSFLDYCRGNVLKYVWRCQLKGKMLEDLRKAAKYLAWAIEEAEKREAKSDAGNYLEIPEGSTPNPGEGYRLLESTEKVIKGDEIFDYRFHRWQESSTWSSGNQDPCFYYRRKIEPNTSETPNTSTCDKKLGAKLDSGQWCWHDGQMWNCCRSQNEPVNHSESPNSSTWVPKVGDKVRVVGVKCLNRGKIGIVERDDGKHEPYLVRFEYGFSCLTTEQLEPADHIPDAEKMVPPEIPEGWRELREGELRQKADMFEWNGEWVGFSEEYDPAKHDAGYNKKFHSRHIRKIETPNTSETPKGSTWVPKLGEWVRIKKCDPTCCWVGIGMDYLNGQIRQIEELTTDGTGIVVDNFWLCGNCIDPWTPKVGDTVRVIKPNLLVSNMDCIITSETGGTYHVTSIMWGYKALCMLPEHLEPIEDAK